jgi:hypothetical protein
MSSIEAGEKMEAREMRGGGYYTANTKGCFDVIANATPNVVQCLETISKDQNPVVIADYGTADGGTSMPMMMSALDTLKAANPDREVTLLYEDQPTNAFKPLFMMTQGLLPGPESYLKKYPSGVFVHATGTSFYEQCAPTGSIHFGFSATAMHWLRKTPGTIKDALHAAMSTEEERAVFAAQGAADWQQNLLQRAKELAPGAKAMFVNFCVDDKGQYLGNTAATGGPAKSMHTMFSELWRAMAREGLITEEEYNNTNFPQHYRTVEEWTAPLVDESGPVYAAGLRLVKCETAKTPCPYHEGWVAGGAYADGEEYAAALIGTLRSWSSGVFLTGLSDTRSAEEKQALVDTFYGRYQAAIAAAPADHGMDYVHAYLTLEKVE